MWPPFPDTLSTLQSLSRIYYKRPQLQAVRESVFFLSISKIEDALSKAFTSTARLLLHLNANEIKRRCASRSDHLLPLDLLERQKRAILQSLQQTPESLT